MNIENISARDLATLIQEAGFRASVKVDSDGDECVESSASGIPFRVFLDLSSSQATKLHFWAAQWVPATSDYRGLCNDFNRDYIAGKLWHAEFPDDDGDIAVFLDYRLDMSGGVSEGWLSASVLMWDLLLTIFVRVLNR